MWIWEWDEGIRDFLEDIGDEGGFLLVLSLVLRVVLFGLKLLVALVYYTLPVILVFVGFFWGGSLGSETGAAKYNDFEEEQIEKLTHDVTIYRADGSFYTVEVREDKFWDVNGGRGVESTPYEFDLEYGDGDPNPDCLETADLVVSGYRFVGLFTSEDGGTCFANGSGCGIRDITSDMKLYAIYEPIPDNGSETVE